MNNVRYYPVNCERCKVLVCYSDIDFKDNSNMITFVWCPNCVEIKPKSDKI